MNSLNAEHVPHRSLLSYPTPSTRGVAISAAAGVLLLGIRALAVARWGETAGHVVDYLRVPAAAGLTALGTHLWGWWSAPETQRRVRCLVCMTAMLAMLLKPGAPHSMSCRCADES